MKRHYRGCGVVTVALLEAQHLYVVEPDLPNVHRGTKGD